MYDAGKVIPGLVLFAALVTLPIWYAAASGQAGPLPTLARATGSGECVLPKGEMRASHMQLLDDWRTSVVRSGHQMVTVGDGRQVRIDLTGTCLGCHTDRAAFCDRCHAYTAVAPTCFDCHVTPAPKAVAEVVR